ncbi:uncharacterized protein A4U43_C07F5380 [Asparagus officinalis]|uniref:Uncharacterized protein n=1 Tax=Asparagus officinalis TaxID=4686 RepID=A0A5P1E9N3_ASPOF|nr:uncharacterized protein LOC109848305 isoform X3 [Asparagus officinalis]ONK62562.1 uncharacterized protein A4U43_C07F5380 [Asparagus officinalis]
MVAIFLGPMAAIAGSFSLLTHSASEKNHERISIHAFSLFFYLVLLFKLRKTKFSLMLVATTISFIGFSLSYLSYTCTDIVTKAAWRAWNIIISIGCLSLFSQVLLSRTSLLVRRNLILWLIISAFMLFFLYKLRREMLFRCMNCALEAAPILISILLFPCQALFQTFGDHKDPGVLGLYFSSTYFWGRKLIKLIVTTLLQRH